MEGDEKIRASDADRERAAYALREHLAAGRLTIEEFEDRLEQAFAAKTLGDLERLMADLPGGDLESLKEATVQRPAPEPAEEPLDQLSAAWHAIWRPWLAVTLFFFAIWVFSGATGAWFVYPSLIAAIVLLRRARRASRDRERDEVGTGRDRRRIER